MQRQFPYLVIIQPVVLQGGDVIALRFLLAVQREGQAVDVCLADNEALAGFVIRQDGKVEGLFGTGGALDMTAVSIVTGDDDLSALLALLVVAVISWLVVLVAYIVALVVCWARAIQLYVMAAFSPIPLAFLGFDQTRQIGLGYLKSFGAVCIAGLIILILLISFPVILGGIVAVNPGTGTPIDAIANGLTYALQYLAMCILLVLSLVKSGAWARDIASGF